MDNVPDFGQEEEQRKFQEKMRNGNFDLQDYLNQMRKMQEMEPLGKILGMMPGMRKQIQEMRNALDTPEAKAQLRRTEALILAMTPKERAEPEIINDSRIRRIAAGSGATVADVNDLLQQFKMMQKMTQMMGKGVVPPTKKINGRLLVNLNTTEKKTPIIKIPSLEMTDHKSQRELKMNATSTNLFQERCRKAQEVMAEQGLDYLFIGPGADLHYLIGTPGMDNERMMLFVIPQKGDPAMIVPRLEKLATSKYATFFELLDWSDDEGPQGRLKQLLGQPGTVKSAVGDHLWSMFLLRLQESLPGAQWTTASQVLKQLRIAKSADEVKLLKEAAAIADRTFSELIKLQFSGRSELEIMNEINRLLLTNGQQEMLFCIVGSGPNGAQPHHHTGDRVIQPGDAVVLDFGGSYRGYCSDMTRMVLVEGGTPDPDYEKVYNVVNEARAAGHRQAKPGVSCQSVDAAARAVITDAGYGEYFVHRTGHGIGMEVHEEPYIVNGNDLTLEPGMAFSIEPGIYLPGRFGVRIEDIAIVTDTGEENINLSTHEIVRVK